MSVFSCQRNRAVSVLPVLHDLILQFQMLMFQLFEVLVGQLHLVRIVGNTLLHQLFEIGPRRL